MSDTRIVGAVGVICCGALLLVLSSGALAGYGLDHPSLYTARGRVMAMNTAFGFFLTGFAIIFIGIALIGIAHSMDRR